MDSYEARLRKFLCTLRVCGRKELPFAGYSVVKDPPTPGGADATKAMVRPRQSSGGEYRARTGDLLVANQALSQLS